MTTFELGAADLARPAQRSTALSRWVILIYGVLCYVMFLGVFLYALGFIGDFIVPSTLNKGASSSTFAALMVNLGLLLAFGLQHSVMARPTFKRWWTRIVPVPAERSTYVLFTNLCLMAMFALWRPMPATIWEIDSQIGRIAMYGLFGFGWFLVLVTTFLINHFDLFGLRQVWLHWRGVEYTNLGFVTPLYYRFVRHPLYVGWICAFWATPRMTLGHLVFAAGATAYILVAIVFEERNLMEHYGSRYEEYRRKTGALVPRLARSGS